MKKIAILTLLIGIINLLVACNQVVEELPPPDQTTYEKINNKLAQLVSYRSEATVKYISNKGENEYITLQQVKSSGHYRIEVLGPDNVAGNITVSNNDTIYQYNKNVNGRVSIGTDDTKERTQILLTSFVKNYFATNNESIQTASLDDPRVTVLTATVSGNHPYIATQELWVNNDTLTPIQLIIKDNNNEERVVVTYNTFEYNMYLDDTLFQLE